MQSEAKAMAKLQHPNVVPVYDVGVHDGRTYVSMEFVEGGSLAQRLAEALFPPQQAAEMTEILARAVHATHQKGIIHRDLKPANVLLTPDGVPKITDFGLAKRLDQNVGLTHSGAIVGTPKYMSPEQAAGHPKEVGEAADIYALGAILYEMLTGRGPFTGGSIEEMLDQVRVKPLEHYLGNEDESRKIAESVTSRKSS